MSLLSFRRLSVDEEANLLSKRDVATGEINASPEAAVRIASTQIGFTLIQISSLFEILKTLQQNEQEL